MKQMIERRSTHAWPWVLAFVIGAAAGGGAYVMLHGEYAAPTLEQRVAAQHAATEAIERSSEWPATPEALIRAFWEAAAKGDYAACAKLSPGAVENDFRFYKQWPPSPAKVIRAAEKHPKAPRVMVYPVTVDFPGFQDKTVKMAVVQGPGGRWVVDGQHTIWW